jgi:nucleolar protein 53
MWHSYQNLYSCKLIKSVSNFTNYLIHINFNLKLIKTIVNFNFINYLILFLLNMNTQSNSNKLKIENLNKKKSKHGKKNWRKNIDISEIEKKDVVAKQEKLLENNVAALKDADLFVIDSAPIQKLKRNFLNKKTERDGKKQKKKLSKAEERLIKRQQKVLLENLDKKQEKSEKEKPQVKNLWDDDDNTAPKLSFPKINSKFPKVPLPHPGQSYNPSREDLSNLLNKIVDHKKQKINIKIENELKTEEELALQEKVFESDSESDDEVKLDNTNNPPVDDFTQRKTKKEKKKNIQKKLNKNIEKDLIKKKENKIILANEKSLKRIEKERTTNIKEDEEKKMLQIQKQNDQEELKRIGVIEE